MTTGRYNKCKHKILCLDTFYFITEKMCDNVQSAEISSINVMLYLRSCENSCFISSTPNFLCYLCVLHNKYWNQLIKATSPPVIKIHSFRTKKCVLCSYPTALSTCPPPQSLRQNLSQPCLLDFLLFIYYLFKKFLCHLSRHHLSGLRREASICKACAILQNIGPLCDFNIVLY